MNKAPFSLDEYKKALDINDVWGEKDYSTIERASTRPTLDVNGIWGGYIGEGAKTVLPSKAYAKISMRLVPNQNSDKISELFARHFEKIAPSSIKVKVTPHHGGEPVLTPTDGIEYRAAAMAYQETFGKEPIPARAGGSIPIVALFEKVLGVKTVLMGFGLEPLEGKKLDSLKILGTVGEPINEEAWHWYNEHIGKNNCPIVDTWWQTETGGCMISNLAGVTPSKPSFATLPLPGIQPVLVDEKQQEIKDYRQQLRDIPQNSEGPDNIIWPNKPWV
jgi:hypothetical protein